MTLYNVSCGKAANTIDEQHFTDSWVEAIRWITEHLTKDNQCRIELCLPYTEENVPNPGLTVKPKKMPSTEAEWQYLGDLYESVLIEAQEENGRLRHKINTMNQRLENQRITIDRYLQEEEARREMNEQ